MKRFRKIKRPLCILLIAAMLISQGCAGTSNTPGNTEDPSENTAYTPQSGGTLRMPMPENARLDTPYIVNTEEMLNLFSLVYEGLLEIDNTGRLNPAIAESWTRSETDESTWTLNLRKNVVWHTGEGITADDVVYSYRTLVGYVTGDFSLRDSMTANIPVDNTDAPIDGQTPDTPDYTYPDSDEPAYSELDNNDPDNNVPDPDNNIGEPDEPDTVAGEDEPAETEYTDPDEGEYGEAHLGADGVFRYTGSVEPPVMPALPDIDTDPDEPNPDPGTDPDDPDNPDVPDEPTVTDEPTETDNQNMPDEPDNPDENPTAAPSVPTNAPAQPNVVQTTPPPPDPTYTPIAADASYYAYNLKRINSMSVVDAYTVSVTMNSTGLSALYALTFPIIPFGAVSTSETDILPGTGPYRVESATKDTVSLSVNNDWWKEAPYITNIVFESRVNNDTALASYEAGQLNMVPTSLLSVGKYRKEGETNVLDVMTQEAELMLFNYDKPVFSDATLRKAINYAIDASRIASNVFMNRAHISDVPVPPDSWFYNTESNIYEYNPTYAKQILEDAGYKDRDDDGILESEGGTRLSFTLLTNSTSDNTTRRNLADLISSQLLQCGIEITIETAPYYLDEAHSDSRFIRKLEEGEYDIALIGVSLSRDGDLTALISPDGSLNYGGLNFPEILESAEAILTAADETEMREASYKFQTEFVDTLPFITLCFRQNSIVYSADIYGVENLREPDLLKNGITGFYVNHSG